MNYSNILESALGYIDENIKSGMTLAEIAERAGYSAYHFSRIFTEETGISVMSYVTWRKLQYALYDLCRGAKIIDVAMEYGFETHGGFTKAFVHWFGFPPSLCYPRINTGLPARMNVAALKTKFYGGNEMNPHIIELTPFSVVGYPERHHKERVKNTGDAPTFWNTINLDYGSILTKLYDAFPKSKHCEISMCYDADGEAFTYMLGRGIDNPDDLANIQPGITRVDIAGGLYAIFSTPPAGEGETFIAAVRNTWNDGFLRWLPGSEFEFDETRRDFEYHDHRDHGWYFGGKLQIDICIPIRQREEEHRKAQLRTGWVE